MSISSRDEKRFVSRAVVDLRTVDRPVKLTPETIEKMRMLCKPRLVGLQIVRQIRRKIAFVIIHRRKLYHIFINHGWAKAPARTFDDGSPGLRARFWFFAPERSGALMTACNCSGVSSCAGLNAALAA